MVLNPKCGGVVPSLKYFLAIILSLVLIAGCTPAPTPESIPDHTTAIPTPTNRSISTPEAPAPMPESTPIQVAGSTIALTNQRLDGNRLAIGSGGMPAEPLDIPLLGRPLWVVGVPVQGGSVWVVTLESGGVQAFQIDGVEIFELKRLLNNLDRKAKLSS